MANYMAEVANILGVEMNEKFELENLPGIPFKLTELGLVCLGPAKLSKDVMNETFLRLLIGCSKIKHRSWKPKYEERYWSIGPGGVLEPGTWLNDFIDIAMYRLGNCYRTSREAEFNRNKWVAFYASDEALEVQNDK